MSGYVRYIERTREYYLSEGYAKPYEWAHFGTVPFSILRKPLRECRLTLITSSEICARDRELTESADDTGVVGGFYAVPSDISAERLFSASHSYDHAATTLDDVDAYFPVTRIREASDAGRIGDISERFHGVFNAYSQRRTMERDAPGVLARCKEDGVDAAVLTPLCPVCHQTISLIARHLEENGIPTVILGTARDIVEHCGVPRFVHSDFPLGNPCGEPFNVSQQREIFEIGLRLLETAFIPRTTVQTPFRWSGGDHWKELVLTQKQRWKSGDVEAKWMNRKEKYRSLKREGKV